MKRIIIDPSDRTIAAENGGIAFSCGPMRIEHYGSGLRLVVELHSEAFADELSTWIDRPILNVPADPHMNKLNEIVELLKNPPRPVLR